MDKMAHTKFNLNIFLISLSSALDNTISNNNYNLNYNSKRVAYIALRLASQYNMSDQQLSDILSYSIIFKSNIAQESINSFPFLDPNITNDKLINKIINIAIQIENNLNIKDDIVINKEEIILSFDNDDLLKNIFDDFTFWFDLTSTSQLPFFIFNYLQDFTIEIQYTKLIDLAHTINKIIYNYTNREYRNSIALKCSTICDFYNFDNKDKSRLIVASLLMNIGLLQIPLNKLLNTQQLTTEDKEIFYKVPYYTNQILSGVVGFDDIVQLSSYIYEKLDGSGYPYRVQENSLSFKNRILIILNVIQAMEETRTYRDKFTKENIYRVLKQKAQEKKFDISIINDFEKIL